MLKVDRARVVFEGRRIDLMVEMTCLMRKMVEDEVFDREDLERMVELCDKTDKELEKITEDALKKRLDKCTPEECLQLFRLLIKL